MPVLSVPCGVKVAVGLDNKGMTYISVPTTFNKGAAHG
jgi:hypothetical protein